MCKFVVQNRELMEKAVPTSMMNVDSDCRDVATPRKNKLINIYKNHSNLQVEQ